MLKDNDVTAMVAVKNLGVAKEFYEGTLGLDPAENPHGSVARYRSGKGTFFVYESEFAGTNKANALFWSAGGEFDALVEDLRARGVTFEHYDLPGLTLEGDVHVAENFKGVWFKDPDGNIIHINA